jgi:hypothetical protein
MKSGSSEFMLEKDGARHLRLMKTLRCKRKFGRCIEKKADNKIFFCEYDRVQNNRGQ